MSDGQSAVYTDFDGTNYEKWILKLDNLTGYYSIKSKESPVDTPYYLCVSGNSSALNTAVVINNSSTLSDGMKWKFVSTFDGAYKIVPKTGEANGYVLSANTSTGGLVQGIYTNNTNYLDEFFLVRIIPTNGYELDYSPMDWNYFPVKGHTNCYSYALNNQVRPGTNTLWIMQPGGASGNAISLSLNKDDLENLVQADSEILHFQFHEVNKYDVCSTGTYKVALYISNNDYHWYRQNSDGTWSHKRGGTDVTNLDASGEIIIDPDYANRSYSTSNYATLIGFYEVMPLNNYYSAGRSDNESPPPATNK